MLWLDQSRIIAIFAVVLLHVAADVVTDMPLGSSYWWVGNVIDACVRWCVPIFVMISGALLLDPAKQESLQSFYTKRVSRVVWPLIFWSAFYMLWDMSRNVIQQGDWHDEILRRLLSGAPYYHLWFLYMILPLYMFAPFFRKVVLNSTRQELTVLIVLLFLISACNAVAVAMGLVTSVFFITSFLSYVAYFFVGYFVRTSIAEYSVAKLWSVFIACVIFTAVGCYELGEQSSLQSGFYFYGYLSVTVIPMSVSLMYLLKHYQSQGEGALIKQVSGLTLGVYLVHPVLLKLLQEVGYGATNFNPLWSVPVISVFIFTLSMALVFLISKLPVVRYVV